MKLPIKITLAVLLSLSVFLMIAADGCPFQGKTDDKRTIIVTGSSGDSFDDAATGLQAATKAHYQIDLTWNDNSNQEDGVKIERKTGVANYSQIAIVGANVISYSDTTLSEGTTYYYRIMAYNSTSDSNYSNVISDTTTYPWSTVACGRNHVIALQTNGTLWSWGNNQRGQLGLSDTYEIHTPTQVGTSTDWGNIAIGYSYTIARKTDGTLWSWGNNDYGQLGIGDNAPRLTPTQIGTETNWSKITVGEDHSAAIKTDGTLWTWGANNWGKLGLGGGPDRNVPTQVGTNTNWSSISCGECHTIALKTDGTLWAWGWNNNGQLGTSDGKTWYVPVQAGASTNWNVIVGSFIQTFAIKSDKTLWSWGKNSYSVLGLGDTVDRTAPNQVGTDANWDGIAGGRLHTIALKSDGTIWGWGYNEANQLGVGNGSISEKNPIQIGVDSDWSNIGGGWNHNMAIKTNGTLWAWGDNHEGRLGLGDIIIRSTPTEVKY